MKTGLGSLGSFGEDSGEFWVVQDVVFGWFRGLKTQGDFGGFRGLRVVGILFTNLTPLLQCYSS